MTVKGPQIPLDLCSVKDNVHVDLPWKLTRLSFKLMLVVAYMHINLISLGWVRRCTISIEQYL